ncbi:hypothetical protein PFAG_00801 [Plasmodium falciparum Santa Lucia]|uniref:Uncharacterized protein n=16 Tax=Plasmodium falciparum TaxID=5833 RepID=Q8IFP0_PLAF7|nr:conserved Plasmodium protein, unknown function [Plasmodium falciparum 3D7]ETW20222.1 hypothetical protein PFFVO_00846 [Plasmodium falciparum Vietnam Oak-Knoll (FVO)]ETW27382.1 hypothetical protein PFFCH_05154 [Plasmodium falciparum FCH/4]ETW32808.1 hypothetical protein PFTANZ_06471 [Plasmodium falciparum Tanzania (2000708)]ETW44712.1 hypothetical protein PFNF135_00924 [Plasmodium falciparum NF135/5.C10]ETW51067.1 hypothetical protein PFMALIP_00871 [Plasmodium falciparum MaliPS096_E11]ETW57|eukprot:XP_001351529.1 conserved Plasmodium protein, unknown function [Plasmodium falciparum 3D7]
MGLTADYSKLSDMIYEVQDSPSLYSKEKYFTQKQNDKFYDIKRFMCLGSTIRDNDNLYDIDKILTEGHKKCHKTLKDTFNVIGYKYCTTNNSDNIKFAKLFYDNYSNLFYCMHLHNDAKKCNSLFKHFYETINYDTINKK